MSFLDLDVGISCEGGNISGTSVELVKIKLKKRTRKTRSDKNAPLPVRWLRVASMETSTSRYAFPLPRGQLVNLDVAFAASIGATGTLIPSSVPDIIDCLDFSGIDHSASSFLPPPKAPPRTRTL